MWVGYVLRELGHRWRQAATVILGIAVAVAVVIVIGGVALGLQAAQSVAVASLYGVGTDITVTRPAAPGSAAPKFNFGKADGASAGGSTQFVQSKLAVARGLATSEMSQATTVAAVPSVSSVESVLMLDNYDFSGVIPDITGNLPPASGDGVAADGPTGADGAGGSSFGVDTFSVAGIDVAHEADAGPLASTTVTAGRALTLADVGQRVALVDEAYAKENQLSVGGPVNIGGVDIPIVGLVTSSSTGTPTRANAYLPLDVAQTLSGLPGQITHVYVKAASSSDVGSIQQALKSALPETVVETQSELAGSVTGSLTTANDLTRTLGLWLSVIAFAAATLLAALFTVAGVTRRTREFGTLKALGWKNWQVSSQVAGEAVVEAIFGTVVGLALGAVSILLVNAFAPSFAATLSTSGASAQIPLMSPFPAALVPVMVGLAIGAALVSSIAGSLRVARLRPSEALRSAE
ncbi:ABC transporter permease [Subtercola frigoramans]|uniref:ABC-type antimicrobial peptide transport system permease subunit n=1 Tax=Subtercola frigoramans TaxID=120298 RepID=A0ABS2L0K4_9MICO|nr:ABC transporter permease [Subtercola frigoramans]MBM7470574.1 ABC-type antimicrobial peptide transport system permease subunit [Subtercola frigoramans]